MAIWEIRDISSGSRLIYDVCMARGGVFIGLAYLAAACVAVRAEERVTSGLLVLYDFEEGAGTTIRDRASAGPALDLRIETPRVVRWRPGAIAIDGSAAIASAAPATKIVEVVARRGEISIEAWINGRSFRLTDVACQVIRPILA
jgi:hypothetical protein